MGKGLVPTPAEFAFLAAMRRRRRQDGGVMNMLIWREVCAWAIRVAEGAR